MTLKLTETEEFMIRRMRRIRERRLRRWKKRMRRPRRVRPKPFTLYVEYKGFDGELDRLIRKAAVRRNHDDGSGFDFVTGERDVSFGFDTKRSAIAAAKRVKKIRGVKAVVNGRVWP